MPKKKKQKIEYDENGRPIVPPRPDCKRCTKPKWEGAKDEQPEEGWCNCGRPPKYKAEYCDDIIAFFKGQPEYLLDPEGNPVTTKNGQLVTLPPKFPTFEGYATKLKTTIQTLLTWQEQYPEFLEATIVARHFQKQILVDNALLKNYDSKFAVFVATNMTDMKQKSEKEVTHKGGLSLTTLLDQANG